MELSKEQEVAVNFLRQWTMSRLSGGYMPEHNYITMGGYAGTGKTTLICELRKQIHKLTKIEVAFVTFTGKASLVLKRKLEETEAIFNEDFVGTIHRLIYKPIFKKDPKTGNRTIVSWEHKFKDEMYFNLIIIDEASMVSKKLWNDLTYYNIPIIAIGDHGQLPPIGDQFSLMLNPQLKLTEVHRQALDSPIIQLSMFIRKNGYIPHGMFEEDKPLSEQKVFKLSWNNDPRCQKIFRKIQFDNPNKDYIALCGMNKTRVRMNRLIRNMIGFTKNYPYQDDKVICLRNNYNTKIFNGQIGNVTGFVAHFSDELYNMTIDFGNNYIVDSMVHKEFFGKKIYGDIYEMTTGKHIYSILKGTDFNSVDAFDWGYCITVHKSQGSEWDNVILFEERSYHSDDETHKRWLYTAVTRAKERLFVIVN